MPQKDICPVCADSAEEMAWIACDVCQQWFHTQCVGLKPGQAELLHSYHCSECVPEHGPSVEKRLLKRNRSKIDYVALNEGVAVDKGVHPHVAAFLRFGANANDFMMKSNRKSTLENTVVNKTQNGSKIGTSISNNGTKDVKNEETDVETGINGSKNGHGGLNYPTNESNGTKASKYDRNGFQNSSQNVLLQDSIPTPPEEHISVQNHPAAHQNLTNPYIDILSGSALTSTYAIRTGLPKPVLVKSPDPQDLGMKLPCSRKDLSVDYITDCVGEDAPVEVMDVQSQQGVSPGWNMGQWRDYFYTDEATRDRLRNVISLEVSQVEGLGLDFVRPQMVRDLDLTDIVWEDEEPRPEVTVYCLMSVKGSFTDFHIDFSGTLVYYTVCKGAKTFLMYPPTEHNLSLYTQWSLEEDQNISWFGTYARGGRHPQPPEGGFRVTLAEGDVFIIPSGWIHAVYTPQDSVVVGGNFLTFMDLQMHLRINDIEKATKVPAKFRYPQFNKVLWMASWYVYSRMEKRPAKEHEETSEHPIKPDLVAKMHQDTGAHHSNGSHASENGLPPLTEPKADPEDPGSHLTPPVLQPLSVLGLTRSSWAALRTHLAAHYELTRAKPAFRKSIPMHLIGKDVSKYLWQITAADISEV